MLELGGGEAKRRDEPWLVVKRWGSGEAVVVGLKMTES